MQGKYNFKAIEAKWQRYWEDHKTFRTPNPGQDGFDPSRPKYYVLDMFPYPSGKGLHVGHPLGYIATDVVARYKRMQGFSVLHPMGFDAFGLPAEQYAVETGTHPQVTTQANIENMRRQLKMCGLGYDWDREISTTDVDYYRWTQWIFLKLYHAYVDPVLKRAQPIQQLVERLATDQLRIDDVGQLCDFTSAQFQHCVAWCDLSNDTQQQILNQHRLAYMAEVDVNWCPALGTVLANEEVTNEGRSERGNYPVFKRPLKQWMLRITAYADRLIEDLRLVDWPEAVREMQKNWVGRSEGAQVKFSVQGYDCSIEVFTTRPDTLFGCTFMVIAPEHPLVPLITQGNQMRQVEAFCATRQQSSSGQDRGDAGQAKEGVFTGTFAINPVTEQPIPIWISDYVLIGYGSGAIMAVPAHDSRDFAFARRYHLPIVPVLEPSLSWLQSQCTTQPQPDQLLDHYYSHPEAFAEAFTDESQAANSDVVDVKISGLATQQAKTVMIQYLEQHQLGKGQVQYKLRDWLFSRQRYWGEPFPILHDQSGDYHAVAEHELPVVLPDLTDFKPQTFSDADVAPQPSLARADERWRRVVVDGQSFERELNTMPQWAGSCWYYLRFLDPRNQNAFCQSDIEQYWMAPQGVDLYVGGVEHAVLHLLYARFWHKVLFDLGFVSTVEPFGRLFNQGYIQAYSYQDERGIYVNAEEVEEVGTGQFTYRGQAVTRHLGKMGKSLKNAIGPDEVIDKYGCDTFRLYEMYLGPLEQSKIWDTEAIIGVHRFVMRFWRCLINEESGELNVVDLAASDQLKRLLHKTIRQVTQYMDHMRFNTAIAQLITMTNHLVGLQSVPREIAEAMIRMLAPLAPHVAEELWELVGHQASVAWVAWPIFDPSLVMDETVEVVVQVNGKRRSSIIIDVDMSQEGVEALALSDQKVIKHIEGKQVRKKIFVANKLLNLVVN